MKGEVSLACSCHVLDCSVEITHRKMLRVCFSPRVSPPLIFIQSCFLSHYVYMYTCLDFLLLYLSRVYLVNTLLLGFGFLWIILIENCFHLHTSINSDFGTDKIECFWMLCYTQVSGWTNFEQSSSTTFIGYVHISCKLESCG